jgi:hypothetical protein
MKLSVEFELNFDGKVVQMQCKICTWIEGKDELLFQSWIFYWKMLVIVRLW